ncbi:amidase [Phreatobacter aquaticus]|uniref:Amidase n=1 Tax=Phreatobacter aquaticus TaxID=2570229 RepID=A0A4D7QIL7_9HYPH|nr:amidase [Phreatobacter aquaticus]QCK87520.1 amidase [Phreatobacter aquaticus]
MTETDSSWPSIDAIAAAVNAGQSSARQQVEKALSLIDRLNPALNAFILVDRQEALKQADAVDRRIAAGERPALAGVPVTIKDNIWVGGWRVTQGSNLFKGFVAPEDAVAVERLRLAGAIIVGITNTSEFAAKGQTRNLLHGATRHPLNPDLTPGGSSGGPVAAVASGMVPFALGTDAGGSSRRPPAHTGLVGFKPSFGAIPYGPGFEEPFFGISCNCPITRTVGEAALAFEAMAGPDGRDPHSALVEPAVDRDPGTLRIAYSPKWGLDVPVDPIVARRVSDAVDKLRFAGLDIIDIDPVWPAGAAETGLNAIQHAGLAALYRDAWRADPSRIDPDLGAQIDTGATYSGVDVANALLLSESVAISAAKWFRDNALDLAIGPTTPCTSWSIDKLGPDTIDGVNVGPRGHAVFTPLFNHARQPAISIPCGTDEAGLPIGLQIVAPRLKDRRLLEAASLLEAVFTR